VHPIILQIGPFTVYSFGVLMALGFYVGASVSAREYERRGGDKERMWNFLVWVFIVSAALFGSCTMGYVLVGDWRYGVFIGLVGGVAFSMVVTVLGFTTPIEKLPLHQPRSSPKVGNG
jgi:prolipoprotein diacylglyceryltransferase